MLASKFALGVDLGATKTVIGLVSANGELIAETRLPTPQSDADRVIKAIHEAMLPFLHDAAHPVAAIGVGVAGQVSFDGVVTFAPNLRWNHVPLQRFLQELTGVSVQLFNDVRAATLGEWHHGAGIGCSDLLCLFVGTGIGGGFISGGKLIVGDNNSAGEVGHITLVWGGRACGCGRRGCFEAYASGSGLATILKEVVVQEPELSKLLLSLVDGRIELLRGEHLAAALDLGDSLAQEIFQRLASALSSGIISLVNTLNPKRLVLGGGVMNGFPRLFSLVESEVRIGGLKASTEKLEILRPILGHKAPIIGAAMTALQV